MEFGHRNLHLICFLTHFVISCRFAETQCNMYLARGQTLVFHCNTASRLSCARSGVHGGTTSPSSVMNSVKSPVVRIFSGVIYLYFCFRLLVASINFSIWELTITPYFNKSSLVWYRFLSLIAARSNAILVRVCHSGWILLLALHLTA